MSLQMPILLVGMILGYLAVRCEFWWRRQKPPMTDAERRTMQQNPWKL